MTFQQVKVSCPTCRTWRIVGTRDGSIKAGTERRHGQLTDCIYELRLQLDEAFEILGDQNRGRSAPGGKRLNDLLDLQTWQA